ncbi:hypothetical protein LCGC14_2019290, partial [marine sediment metagenome]
INKSHKEIIIEVLEKTDQAIMDRFKQIDAEVKTLEKEKDKIQSYSSLQIDDLDQKVKKLEKDWNDLMNRVYFNES